MLKKTDRQESLIKLYRRYFECEILCDVYAYSSVELWSKYRHKCNVKKALLKLALPT